MSSSLLITNSREFLPRESASASLPLIEDDELVALLASASNTELDGIVQCLIQRGKWTCQLKRLETFKQASPNHRAYSRDIAAEIQKYGGNTLANHLWRDGRGIRYEDIVKDVAKRLNVSPRSTSRDTEHAIREHLLAELWNKMPINEREALLEEYKIRDPSLVLKAVIPAALLKATTLTGFGAYKASVILANAFAKAAIGHGLTLVSNASLTKGLSIFLGPVGWTIAGAYAAQVIGSEAYRVTVPCVLQISMIREAAAIRPKEIKKKWNRAAIVSLLLLVGAAVLYFAIRG